MHAVDLLNPAPVIEQLHDRAMEAAAKLEVFELERETRAWCLETARTLGERMARTGRETP